MIHVELAPEPTSFDRCVRKKGRSALDEMVGRPPRCPHSGPRREKIASREQDIPPGQFPPFWRDAIDDMLEAYGRICAFLSLYLESATGNPSVDHMLPKSKHWDKVYEWDNYRLCAARINGLKKDMIGIVDPFSCGANWFALELVGFQVIKGDGAPAYLAVEIDATLPLLNGKECCRAREEYVQCYMRQDISLAYLERRAPWVAAELRRQRRLHRGDS